MKKINVEISGTVFSKAQKFEQFRAKCKAYLTKANFSWDKFTVVSHDSFIGYVTEYAISKYLQKEFQNIVVESWEQQFDMHEIIKIVDSGDFSEPSKELVKSYFYDKWDLKIDGVETRVLSDVKTALTQRQPAQNWNFLYPVVQANKEGKDIMILVYYVVTDIYNLNSLKELILVGYTKPEVIRSCPIIKAGEKTRFGTTSQIDNYETELSKHYFDLKEILK